MGICEIMFVAQKVTVDMLSTKAGRNFGQKIVGVSLGNSKFLLKSFDLSIPILHPVSFFVQKRGNILRLSNYNH